MLQPLSFFFSKYSYAIYSLFILLNLVPFVLKTNYLFSNIMQKMHSQTYSHPIALHCIVWHCIALRCIEEEQYKNKHKTNCKNYYYFK